MTDDELLTLPIEEIAARCPRLSQREDVLFRLHSLSDAAYRDRRDRWHQIEIRAGEWRRCYLHDYRETLEAMDAFAIAVRTVAMARILSDIVAGRSVSSSPHWCPLIEACVYGGGFARPSVSWVVLRHELGREAVILAEIEGDRYEVAPLVLAAIAEEIDR